MTDEEIKKALQDDDGAQDGQGTQENGGAAPASDTGAAADGGAAPASGTTSAPAKTVEDYRAEFYRPNYRDPAEGTGIPKQRDYQDQYARINPLESDADYQKRHKNVRNATLMSALADGISAMANLWGTAQYASPATLTSATGKVNKYKQQMEDARTQAKEKWAAGMQRAKQLDEARDDTNRNWRLRINQLRNAYESQRAADDRANRDAAAKAEQEAYNISRRPVAEVMQDAQLTEAKVKAAHAEENAQLDKKAKEAQIRHLNTIGTGGYGRGGGSTGNYHVLHKSFPSGKDKDSGSNEAFGVIKAKDEKYTRTLSPRGNIQSTRVGHLTPDEKAGVVESWYAACWKKYQEKGKLGKIDTDKLDELKRRGFITDEAWWKSVGAASGGSSNDVMLNGQSGKSW